ncbi:MAG TPA: hypothetical protein VMT18_15255 [Planctomycetota bacterium]|nr:hypothetical protein [Planctomycetota bacterium]
MSLGVLLTLLTTTGFGEFERLDATLAAPGATQDVLFGFDEPSGFLGEGLEHWPVGRSLWQGYIGVLVLEAAAVSGGTTPPIDLADDAFEMLPSLGGGAQYKLGGERASWGIEGMVDFAGRSDGVAFYSGAGGALLAVDVDLATLALCGGPFVSLVVGEKVRVYAAGGGLMQWTWYDQTGASAADTADGNGFGAGYYARAGFEYLLPNHTLLGLGGRWSDARVDLSGDLGHMELRGTQVLLTVSRSM